MRILGRFRTEYWHGLYACLVQGATFQELRVEPPLARLQIYWLALHVRLWSVPHYRSGTFANDARKNLRNVALPGTGVPLSLLFYVRPVALLFLWIGVPLVAAGAAVPPARGRRLRARRCQRS